MDDDKGVMGSGCRGRLWTRKLLVVPVSASSCRLGKYGQRAAVSTVYERFAIPEWLSEFGELAG